MPLFVDSRHARPPPQPNQAFDKDHLFLCLAEYMPEIPPAAAEPVYPFAFAVTMAERHSPSW
jgi:hypothetical protein